MKKWNRVTLLQACEDLVHREDVTLKLRNVDPSVSTAHVDYRWNKKRGPYDIEIVLDPSQGGLIESLIHECLHVVLDSDIASCFNATLEEKVIAALEQDLWRKRMKKRDVVRWRALINSKLEEGSDEPSTSVCPDPSGDSGGG